MEMEQGRVIQTELQALALDPTLCPLSFLHTAAGGVFHKSDQAIARLKPTDGVLFLTQDASQSLL